jgi:sortase A
MGSSRRLIAVLVAGLVLSGVAAVWVGKAAPTARAADSPALASRSITVTSIVHLPSEPDGLQQPVNPPADPYAPEPIRLLGTIEIPKISLVHKIYQGITLNNIDLGPSHWPGTAYPGQLGNAVFAGHRVTHTHPFLHIDQLVDGDQVIFTIGATRSVYKVTGHEVVSPSELRITQQTTSVATATLFACHPPHSASYRYVVHLALDSLG